MPGSVVTARKCENLDAVDFGLRVWELWALGVVRRLSVRALGQGCGLRFAFKAWRAFLDLPMFGEPEPLNLRKYSNSCPAF